MASKRHDWQKNKKRRFHRINRRKRLIPAKVHKTGRKRSIYVHPTTRRRHPTKRGEKRDKYYDIDYKDYQG